MNELLTINEYSKIRGCSVSAVYKRLKSPSNRIHNFVVKKDGQTFLKAELLDLEGFRRPDPGPAASDPEGAAIEETPSNTPPKTVEEVEEEVERKVEEGIGALAIRALEQQLLQKDQEIADLNRRLEAAAIHEREMADKVAALAAQANELQKNNQILLAQAQQQPMLEEPKKPGILKRIFG